MARLQIWLVDGWFLLAADAGQRLGRAADGVGSGQADFGGPTLNDRPEPVTRTDVPVAAMSARLIAVMAVLRSKS